MADNKFMTLPDYLEATVIYGDSRLELTIEDDNGIIQNCSNINKLNEFIVEWAVGVVKRKGLKFEYDYENNKLKHNKSEVRLTFIDSISAVIDSTREYNKIVDLTDMFIIKYLETVSPKAWIISTIGIRDNVEHHKISTFDEVLKKIDYLKRRDVDKGIHVNLDKVLNPEIKIKTLFKTIDHEYNSIPTDTLIKNSAIKTMETLINPLIKKYGKKRYNITYKDNYNKIYYEIVKGNYKKIEKDDSFFIDIL